MIHLLIMTILINSQKLSENFIWPWKFHGKITYLSKIIKVENISLPRVLTLENSSIFHLQYSMKRYITMKIWPKFKKKSIC